MEKRRRRRRPTINTNTNTNTNTNSISLSLFGALTQSFSLDKTTAKSTPRTRRRSSFFFENGGSGGGGGVGLGIVAAMSGSNNSQEATSPATKVTNLLPSPRSNPPISIASLAKPAANFKAGTINIIEFERIVDESHDDDDDDDESYTCVISHVGNDVIEKHVYYGFDNSNSTSNSNSDSMRIYDDRPALFYTSSSPTTTVSMNIGVGSQERREFWTSDFLSSCYLCNKPLHGLDIFMYRGEKAFCSVECRDKQIRSEDYKEKCGSEAGTAHDYSASPCTSPQVFLAGVAAA